VTIRHYQPGDEAAQAAIFNAAAVGLPAFKPATVLELQRRIRVRDFDPTLRLYVEAQNQVVGYGILHKNGRVSYPWCLPGFESQREPLFEAMLAQARGHGVARAFAAYRNDWRGIGDFFLSHGFAIARELVNFYIPFHEMPTPSTLLSSSMAPVTPEDVPQILALAPEVLRVETAAELEHYLFKNPYFTPDALFALRSRLNRAVLAVGIFVRDSTYASAEAIDPQAPCFRLGAFGAEGMASKRVNGLFSFLTKADRTLNSYGLELMGEAAGRVSDDDTMDGLAAQAPSDVPALIAFYHKFFRRQGSFPVYERELG